MKGVSVITVFRLRSRVTRRTPRKATRLPLYTFISTDCLNRRNAVLALPMRASRGMSTGRLVWRRKSSRRKNLSGRTPKLFERGSESWIVR